MPVYIHRSAHGPEERTPSPATPPQGHCHLCGLSLTFYLALTARVLRLLALVEMCPLLLLLKNEDINERS